MADEQRLDGPLLDGRTAGALADESEARLRRVSERGAVDERVVEDDVGFAQTRHCAEREQLGIARAGTDEGDKSARHRCSS